MIFLRVSSCGSVNFLHFESALSNFITFASLVELLLRFDQLLYQGGIIAHGIHFFVVLSDLVVFAIKNHPSGLSFSG